VGQEDLLEAMKALKEAMLEEKGRLLAELEAMSQLLRDITKERLEPPQRAKDPTLTLPVALASDGRVTVPEAVREYLGVRQGDILVVKVVKVVRKSRLRPKQ